MTEKEFKQKWESFLTNGYVRKDASEHEYHRVWKDILDTFQTIRAESERQGEQNDKLVPILIEYIEKKKCKIRKIQKRALFITSLVANVMTKPQLIGMMIPKLKEN